MGQVTARRLLLIGAAIAAVGGVAAGVGWGVRTLLVHGDYEAPVGEPAKDPAKALLAQLDTDAPVASGIVLPTAHAAEGIRKPHPRLEIGPREVRLFGDVVGTLPAPDATALDANVLGGPAEWAHGVVIDAGRETRTVELAIDRSVRFGVVLDAILQLVRADWQPTLVLVTNEAGELRVFPVSARLPSRTIDVDATGAHVVSPDGGVPACTWQRGTPTAGFVGCLATVLVRPQPAPRDAGASTTDAGELTALAELMIASQVLQRTTVMLTPSRDARWEDVVAMLDACAGASLEVGLGRQVDGTF